MTQVVLSELSKAVRSLRRAANKGRCAVATGSLSVLSAEALASQWERLGETAATQREELIDSGANAHAAEEVLGERAACYRHCAHELRRQMGLPTNRQPKENKQI